MQTKEANISITHRNEAKPKGVQVRPKPITNLQLGRKSSLFNLLKGILETSNMLLHYYARKFASKLYKANDPVPKFYMLPSGGQRLRQ